jgi:hypothetical protein
MAKVGGTRSEEHRLKVVASLRGNQRRKGIPHDEATKARISASQKGASKSEEHKQKISEARKAFFASKAGEQLREKMRNSSTRFIRSDGPVTYQAYHYRVIAERGRPSLCEICGTTDGNAHFEWANLTGNYADASDYKRLCKSCHNRLDGVVKNLQRAV